MRRDLSSPQSPGGSPGEAARALAQVAPSLKVGEQRGELPVVGRGEPSRRARRALARSASRERQAAELLGTTRTRRSRYESAPDVAPVTLPCGIVLQAEVKTR